MTKAATEASVKGDDARPKRTDALMSLALAERIAWDILDGGGLRHSAWARRFGACVVSPCIMPVRA